MSNCGDELAALTEVTASVVCLLSPSLISMYASDTASLIVQSDLDNPAIF